jgi:hypothetical protein
MANPIQWSVDTLYNEIGKLEAEGRNEIAALNDQKARLQDAYTRARTANDQPMMTFLQPLIHRNSSLRIKAKEFAARFNELVGKASGFLKHAGLTVPATITGMGIAPALVIVPAAVVAVGLICWGILHEMNSGRIAIDNALQTQGPELLKIIQDPAAPPDQKAAASAAYKKLLGEAGAQDDWVKQLTPILGLVALIVIAPSVLKMLPGKRAA